MKYLEVCVKTTHDFAETVSNAFFDLGSAGVAIFDREDLKDILEGRCWDYVEENLLEAGDAAVIVKGYFYEPIDLDDFSERLHCLQAELGIDAGLLELEAIWSDDADYKDEWKKYFKTLIFGKLAVVPSWLEKETDKINVLLDPGAAFGTGAHETTGMCLKLMQDVDLTGKSVIDLGCGSAILGLAALKLGAENCVFVDVDEMALSVAKSNVALNGETERAKFYLGDIRQTNFLAEFLFANITADILVMLSEGLSRHLKSGGQLILSGIIDREFLRVKDTFLKLGYVITRHILEGDWHAIQLANPINKSN